MATNAVIEDKLRPLVQKLRDHGLPQYALAVADGIQEIVRYETYLLELQQATPHDVVKKEIKDVLHQAKAR